MYNNTYKNSISSEYQIPSLHQNVHFKNFKKNLKKKQNMIKDSAYKWTSRVNDGFIVQKGASGDSLI